MFEPDAIYTDHRLAQKVGRTSRTIRNWRKRGTLPPHDAKLGDDGGYFGSTLNRFMRVADALGVELQQGAAP